MGKNGRSWNYSVPRKCTVIWVKVDEYISEEYISEKSRMEKADGQKVSKWTTITVSALYVDHTSMCTVAQMHALRHSWVLVNSNSIFIIIPIPKYVHPGYKCSLILN